MREDALTPGAACKGDPFTSHHERIFSHDQDTHSRKFRRVADRQRRKHSTPCRGAAALAFGLVTVGVLHIAADLLQRQSQQGQARVAIALWYLPLHTRGLDEVIEGEQLASINNLM